MAALLVLAACQATPPGFPSSSRVKAYYAPYDRAGPTGCGFGDPSRSGGGRMRIGDPCRVAALQHEHVRVRRVPRATVPQGAAVPQGTMASHQTRKDVNAIIEGIHWARISGRTKAATPDAQP